MQVSKSGNSKGKLKTDISPRLLPEREAMAETILKMEGIANRGYLFFYGYHESTFCFWVVVFRTVRHNTESQQTYAHIEWRIQQDGLS